MTARLSKYAIAAAVGLVVGLTVNAWRYEGKIATLERQHAERMRDIAEESQRVSRQLMEKQLAAERAAAELDEKHTKELINAKDENNRLRDMYSDADDERRRLRIEVRVARSDATVSAATSPGSLGDAAALELSEESGRSVWNIREGMISDREKLLYLQEWARAVIAK